MLVAAVAVRARNTGLLQRSSLRDFAPQVGAAAGATLAGAFVSLVPRGITLIVGFLALAVTVAVPADVLIGGLLVVRNLTDPPTTATSGEAVSGGLNLNAAIGAALVAIIPVRLWLAKRPIGVPWMLLAAGLIVTWFLVALLVHGNDPSLTRELVRALSVVAVACAAANLMAEGDNGRKIVWLILLSAAIPTVVALLQTSGLISTGGTAAGRARGTFTQANAAATFFAMCLTLAVWLVMTSRRGRRRVPAMFAAALALALMGTRSLGGIADGFISLLVLTSLLPVRPRVRHAAGGAAVVLILLFVASPLGAERVSELATTQTPAEVSSTGNTTNSLDWRFYNWTLFLDHWEEHPVVGNGLGTTLQIINPLGVPPHSDLIRVLVEAGIVGLLLTLVFLMRVFRTLWSRARQVDPSTGLAIPALAVSAGALVQALDQSVSTNTAQLYVLVVLIAAAVVRPRSSA